MKILYSNPPWWQSAETPDAQGQYALRQGRRAGSRWPFTMGASYPPDGYVWGSYTPYPFFLGSAAAWAKRAMPENQVLIRDSIARGESYHKFYEYLKEEKPDCIVIETGAAAVEHDFLLISQIKARLPKVRIALAGPVAASLAKRESPRADAYLLGEYEKGAVLFVYGKSGEIPFDLLTHGQLKNAPFPLFDEPVALNYWDSNPVGTLAPELQLWASRGCYHVCNFCAWPATMTGNDPLGLGGRPVRFYDPEWIEKFICLRMDLADMNKTPLRSVKFDDDSFNLKESHVLEICAVMKRIGLPWSAMCRADKTQDSTWRAMKESGCFGVKLGFESGSQRVIDEIIHKKLDLAAAAKTAAWLRQELGMSVHGTFTVNLPGETPEERAETVQFIEKLYRDGALDTHQLSGTAEIPGTPMEAQGKEDPNYIKNPDGQLKMELMK